MDSPKPQDAATWLTENIGALHTFMRRRESNPHTAEDLSQKLAEKILKSEASGIRIENIGAYAWRAAHTTLVDHYRAKAQIPLDEIGDEFSDRREPAEHIHELRALLHPEIKNLPMRMKQVIWLRYYEGMRSKEVAEVLGIAEVTVNNYHHLAVNRLRVELAKRGVTDLEGALEH
ncbi:sigma-70 family RNA polymerase sigma factor [Streptomyces sp. NPDC046881]|uniref:RNA polymerase sigma factor n=1 Tax=Streptomyces sp. NPDC046881 TaxID=3155374 RepID=UPI0033C7C104